MGRFEKTRLAAGWFFGGFADLVLPGVCWGCRGALPQAGGLCDECNIKLLSLVVLPYCPRCGSTIGPNIPIYPDGCPQCPTPLPRFSRVFRLGPYANPLRSAIRDLKYHGRHNLSGRLGEMLVESLQARADDELRDEEYDIIIPTPMHWTRRILRGGNHAAVLAERLGGVLGLPIACELFRTRNTPPQVHLSRTQRVANVRGAFEASAGRGLAGMRILLVDDVTTTGATANEAARTLLAAGASKVDLAVLAKAESARAYTQHWQ